PKVEDCERFCNQGTIRKPRGQAIPVRAQTGGKLNTGIKPPSRTEFLFYRQGSVPIHAGFQALAVCPSSGEPERFDCTVLCASDRMRWRTERGWADTTDVTLCSAWRRPCI